MGNRTDIDAPLAFSDVTTVGLTKMYGVTRALSGVELHLEAGTVTSIEGPNGSGKSTLLSLLAGISRPTRGEVRYGALPNTMSLDEARPYIGLLGHAPMLYPDLTAKENLLWHAQIYDVPDAHARTEKLIREFDLTDFMDRPVRTYSRGQLQRVAIARAIVHSPTFLLLDEPSTGLDAHALARLIDVIEAQRARGAIQVLITHDAALAERVATHRIRMERGALHEMLL